MARSNPKALTIAVVGINMGDPTLERFAEKGHTVLEIEGQEAMEMGLENMDVIIGPRCWRIDPQLKLGQDATVEESLERQLEMMEKGVRAIKYPKEKKDVGS